MKIRLEDGRGVKENPPCKHCGARMLRWAWYECEGEPVEYWYCLECDRAGREPCIQIIQKGE